MNQAADKIRQEVFGCEHCAKLGAFTRSLTNQRFYKFPPIIGAPGKAELLFIGINPRRTQSNQELHDWLMESPEKFARLASNRLALDDPYITPAGIASAVGANAVAARSTPRFASIASCIRKSRPASSKPP